MVPEGCDCSSALSSVAPDHSKGSQGGCHRLRYQLVVLHLNSIFAWSLPRLCLLYCVPDIVLVALRDSVHYLTALPYKRVRLHSLQQGPSVVTDAWSVHFAVCILLFGLSRPCLFVAAEAPADVSRWQEGWLLPTLVAVLLSTTARSPGM